MQLSLYNVETWERTMLVGLTRAQLIRFQVAPGTTTDLKAYLDEAGHLAVWECQPTADARVELVQPILLQAASVVACNAAPFPPLPLAA